MKKNGFTLIELIVVIVIIALLMVLTIPNILKISKQTKLQAYDTKISLIEKAAVDYGNDNKSYIMKGQTPLNTSSQVLKITADNKTGKVYSVDMNGRAYTPGETLGDSEYRGNKVTVKQLVEAGYLKYDEENSCTGDNCDDYSKIVVDPTNNYIINYCHVYLYYKYQRVYAYFDRNTCDSKTPNIVDGKEYAPR